MGDFRIFPWRYITRVLESREFFFEQSMAPIKEEFGGKASMCPNCGKKADNLIWVPVDTADETWLRGEGQSGFVTCCLQCKTQIDFFVDQELTRLEAELRAEGKSSQELPWSETDPVD